MANHKHFIIEDECKKSIDFAPIPTPVTVKEPVRDNMMVHGDYLLQNYESAVLSIENQLHQRQRANKPTAKGYYLDIELTDANVKEDKLSSKTGTKLMAITPALDDANSNRLIATVYLPKEHAEWLPKRVKDYQTKQTSNTYKIRRR